jgi:Rrf2 family protein
MAFSLALTQAVYIYIFVRDKTLLNKQQLVPTSLIAETLEIPKPSVVKILRGLTQDGLLSSGTGIKGGVSLAPGAETHTLLDLFHAVEGRQPLFRLDHSFGIQGDRPQKARKAVAELFSELENTLKKKLSSIALSSISELP